VLLSYLPAVILLQPPRVPHSTSISRDSFRAMTYDSDVEHATESTSMLRRDTRDRDKKKPGKFWLWRLLDLFTGGIYAPNASTYAPIEIILNTQDELEQDRLTERWRDNRLSELSFVGVVVSSYLCIDAQSHVTSWSTRFPELRIQLTPHHVVRTSCRSLDIDRIMARHRPRLKDISLASSYIVVLWHHPLHLQHLDSRRPDCATPSAIIPS
jgi:hypothetical protein